ncbi:serine protease [Coprinellus micaceus]|uniref:Serine protease n=1 Tax=Coprinellus micaceus TaxID=71717 RepID=A0A4Y7S774_COPMI|nr:serine protease [Coprinellus micaceus]
MRLFIGFCFAATALVKATPESPLDTSGVPSIVTLKPGISASSLLESIGPAQDEIVEPLVRSEWSHALNGFSAILDPILIDVLSRDPRVENIEEDGIVRSLSPVTQTNAPWGLGRLSSIPKLANQNSTALTFNYTYDSSGGAGVDIYVLDTGTRITHVEFEGRATWGAIFSGSTDADGNGHGTHCAGIVAGKTFGVAKRANIVAVKVLADSGSGSTSQVISGINWIIQATTSSARPSVVLIALGGSANTALDNAVLSLFNSGIHVVVAAGGSATTPESSSPGRVPQVITVGATTVADARAPSSNYGLGIDIYAPGTNILSAWYTSDTATATLSGTSMAAAHVAGLVAYLIGLEGNTTPAAMSDKIKDYGLPNVLSGIPSEGINYLAHNAPH